MIFDKQLDKITKPNRPLPSNRVSEKEVLILSIAFFLISLLIAASTNNVFFVTLIILFIFVSFIYSHPILNFKKYVWGSSVTGTIQYAIIPFLSAFSISNTELPLIFFFYYTLTFISISNIKDIEDINGEKYNNVQSVPIIIGIKNTLRLVILSPIIINFFILLSAILEHIKIEFVFSAIFSIFIYITFGLIILKSTNNSIKITTQSNSVTLITIATLISQLAYGIVALF